MSGIILCADDFSQSPAINRGILDLVEMGRLDAVSCLTLSPSWRNDAFDLRAAGSPRVGLHFNLTLPFGQSGRKVSSVLAAALLRTIDRDMVRFAFERQWHEFIRQWDAPPDFIDGHQHVHTFPVIRDVVIRSLVRLGFNGFVRTLRPPPTLPAGPLKRRLLESLSGKMVDELGNSGIPTNPAFAGFRSYRKPGGFRTHFRQWLAASGPGTLVMCHPGASSDDISDPIRAARMEEFDYLSSPAFESDRAGY